MSGAQAKAAVIAGCVGVIAEVSKEALMKRLKQGLIYIVGGHRFLIILQWILLDYLMYSELLLF